jgi:hypothetical protein
MQQKQHLRHLDLAYGLPMQVCWSPLSTPVA